jgi:hypothetical protein
MKLMHIFWDADMRCRHAGLAARAKKDAGINIQKLNPEQLLVFVNTRMNMLAVLGGVNEKESNGVLAVYKSPGGRKLYAGALKYIPASFGSNGEINMNEATRKALLDKLGERAKG